MLFFLRKVRKALLTKNRFSTYLLYAIGEIILVVIGILIAVSINDWNEAQKEARQEIVILKNLNDDLKYNLLELRRVYAEDSLQVVDNRRLLAFMQDPQAAYHDSLQTYFGQISRYDVFSPRRMAYEALKSKSLDLIHNEELRSDIIRLYDEQYPLNTLMLDLRKDIHINSMTLANKRFLTLNEVNRTVPTNFEKLRTDHEFINNLSYIAAEGANFVSHLYKMRAQTVVVQEKIRQELQKLSR
ncbi:DUF6090 family protein [Robiginitalea sp. IMCC43444]|uniref:DUF6090 family protein n=1 Tax=Robiginitalea sp. IMCC43444 TaxID=3459121 RepID=UPI004040EF1E